MSRIEPTGRFVLFTAQKNEMPYILEWIAYHKVVGFTDIIVMSNDCDDGSDELLDHLQALGEVQHFRHSPGDKPPQIAAEKMARELGLFQNGDWVMWLDLDEFLVLDKSIRNLPALIDHVAPAEAIGFNWRIFGDANLKHWPGRQVHRKFNRAAKYSFRRQRNIKTLFQYSDKVERLELHRPVLHEDIDNPEKFHFVNGANTLEAEMPFLYYGRLKDGQKVPRHYITVKHRYQLGQVNHYMVRHKSMFKRKKARGRGYVSTKAGDKSAAGAARHNDKYYDFYNRNESFDRRIFEYLPALDTELERILDRFDRASEDD